MSDANPSLADKAAKNSLLTLVGQAASSLSLVAIIWLASTVTGLDKQFAALRAEFTAGVVPRISAAEFDIQNIQSEMSDRTRDRFTATDAAALELRLLREIGDLQGELRRFIEKQESEK